MIVMQFGGTSLIDAAAFLQSVAVVEAQLSRRPVVVSATAGTMDALFQVESARQGRLGYALSCLDRQRERHHRTFSELSLSAELQGRDVSQAVRRLHGEFFPSEFLEPIERADVSEATG